LLVLVNYVARWSAEVQLENKWWVNFAGSAVDCRTHSNSMRDSMMHPDVEEQLPVSTHC
jgi:hypothetical protein